MAQEKQKTIMVLGKSESLQQDLKEILSLEGFNIVGARGPKDALAILHGTEKVDMVLAEISIDEFSFFEFFREAIKIGHIKEKPFVLLTDMNAPEDIVRVLVFGADEYIKMPFDPKTLIKKIRDVFEQTKREQKMIEDGIQ